MISTTKQSAAVLCEEILAEAHRKGAEAVARAGEQAAALHAQAQADAETARRDRLSRARAEAARRSELLLAAVPVEIGRLRRARIDALLRSVHDEARRRLLARKGFDYGETVVRLAALAIRGMEGDSLIVKLSPEDRAALGPGLVDAITSRAGRSPLAITLLDDPALTGGGVLVEDGDGRQVWDNRLAARLARLWPDLRNQIAVKAGLVASSAGAAP